MEKRPYSERAGYAINPVGAAEGCDLLILVIKSQKIAACGSSYKGNKKPGTLAGFVVCAACLLRS
ncbi:hypothetical protein ICA16_14420 [Pseudomonas anatoliensis]|uniref:hypothetical protein n=1 Tax=Pseudomonas anatoliensis TaxID=2710589 RepID=UPI001B337797|nr:hypothetical protein [Pseudomonas anatoliensis]MBP5956864.1 hypothetical protein [Pseudomonas anatoliensis]